MSILFLCLLFITLGVDGGGRGGENRCYFIQNSSIHDPSLLNPSCWTCGIPTPDSNLFVNISHTNLSLTDANLTVASISFQSFNPNVCKEDEFRLTLTRANLIIQHGTFYGQCLSIHLQDSVLSVQHLFLRGWSKIAAGNWSSLGSNSNTAQTLQKSAVVIQDPLTLFEDWIDFEVEDNSTQLSIVGNMSFGVGVGISVPLSDLPSLNLGSSVWDNFGPYTNISIGMYHQTPYFKYPYSLISGTQLRFFSRTVHYTLSSKYPSSNYNISLLEDKLNMEYLNPGNVSLLKVDLSYSTKHFDPELVLSWDLDNHTCPTDTSLWKINFLGAGWSNETRELNGSMVIHPTNTYCTQSDVNVEVFCTTNNPSLPEYSQTLPQVASVMYYHPLPPLNLPFSSEIQAPDNNARLVFSKYLCNCTNCYVRDYRLYPPNLNFLSLRVQQQSDNSKVVLTTDEEVLPFTNYTIAILCIFPGNVNILSPFSPPFSFNPGPDTPGGSVWLIIFGCVLGGLVFILAVFGVWFKVSKRHIYHEI